MIRNLLVYAFLIGACIFMAVDGARLLREYVSLRLYRRRTRRDRFRALDTLTRERNGGNR